MYPVYQFVSKKFTDWIIKRPGRILPDKSGG
jgi:hypothetical protein